MKCEVVKQRKRCTNEAVVRVHDQFGSELLCQKHFDSFKNQLIEDYGKVPHEYRFEKIPKFPTTNLLMKKPPKEEIRKMNLNWIIEQCKLDPQLAVEVANYLDNHLELKLEKIEGDPVSYLLKRSSELGEKRE